MKRWLAVLLLILQLPIFALAADEDNALNMVQQKRMNVYLIEEDNRLVSRAPSYPTKKMKTFVAALNEAIDGLGEDRPPIYVYLVESSRSHRLARTFSVNSKAYKYIKKTVHADYFDHLKFTTYEEFCNYFYSTDHHWNYKGSYQGYVDVVRLLLGEEEEVLVPAEVVEIPQIFNGSYANRIKLPISKENFAFYKFDPFPQYTAYQYGKKRTYDHYDIYLKGKYKKGRYANHYAQCYGGDAGLMIFESEQHKDRTLLIIGNSLTNAVKPLLTAHFGKIIYVDLRSYKSMTKKAFSLSKAVQDYAPTQILLFGDAYLFTTDDTLPKP